MQNIKLNMIIQKFSEKEAKVILSILKSIHLNKKSNTSICI